MFYISNYLDFFSLPGVLDSTKARLLTLPQGLPHKSLTLLPVDSP